MRKTSVDASLDKITDVRTPVLPGRTLGYGDLTMVTASSTPTTLDQIIDAIEFKKAIMEAQDAIRRTRSRRRRRARRQGRSERGVEAGRAGAAGRAAGTTRRPRLPPLPRPLCPAAGGIPVPASRASRACPAPVSHRPWPRWSPPRRRSPSRAGADRFARRLSRPPRPSPRRDRVQSPVAAPRASPVAGRCPRRRPPAAVAAAGGARWPSRARDRRGHARLSPSLFHATPSSPEPRTSDARPDAERSAARARRRYARRRASASVVRGRTITGPTSRPRRRRLDRLGSVPRRAP